MGQEPRLLYWQICGKQMPGFDICLETGWIFKSHGLSHPTLFEVQCCAALLLRVSPLWGTAEVAQDPSEKGCAATAAILQSQS